VTCGNGRCGQRRDEHAGQQARRLAHA
jgi:hypothetical protein